MVLTWTGRGILVFVIFIVMAAIALVLTMTFIAEPYGLSANQGVEVTIIIASLLTAAVTYPLGHRFAARPLMKRVVDPTTGQEHSIRVWDTFLWMDMRYWPHLLVVVAVVLAVIVWLG